MFFKTRRHKLSATLPLDILPHSSFQFCQEWKSEVHLRSIRLVYRKGVLEHNAYSACIISVGFSSRIIDHLILYPGPEVMGTIKRTSIGLFKYWFVFKYCFLFLNLFVFKFKYWLVSDLSSRRSASSTARLSFSYNNAHIMNVCRNVIATVRSYSERPDTESYGPS